MSEYLCVCTRLSDSESNQNIGAKIMRDRTTAAELSATNFR
jgi:hypothetical protein